jgi:hypothetical protein
MARKGSVYGGGVEALRAGFADMLRVLGEHKFEVLDETGGKRIVLWKYSSRLEQVLAGSRICGDAFALGRHVEAKDGSFLQGTASREPLSAALRSARALRQSRC